jgi:hypothetical protein
MGRLAAVCCALAVVLASAPADARPASKGWFAEGGLGAVAFLPPRASRGAALGPSLGVRVGRDLFSWLSLNVHVAASSHEAIVPPPPEGEWFQLYRGAADLRLTGRLDRLALYAEGGAGLVMISSNVLGKLMITDPGESFGVMFGGGAGFEYQLENRHYSIGVGIDAFFVPQFAKMSGLDSRAFLRYTY